MECLRAMQILSEGSDRGEVDGIGEARDHCETCSECREFALGLAALSRLTPPEPGPDLLSRVLDAVEAERAAEGGAGSAVGPVAPVTPITGTGTPPRRPANVPRLVLAAAAVAALVGVALITRAGVLSMTGGARDVAKNGSFGASDAAQPSLMPPPVTESAPESSPRFLSDGPSATMDSSAAARAGAATATASYISFGGLAYALAGPQQVPQSQLVTAGTTLTSLAAGTSAKRRTVYTRAGTADVLLLRDDAGRLLVFRPSYRVLSGSRYALTTQPLYAFGQWPSLPSRYPRPVTADGSPTFRPAGFDELGVAVFSPPDAEPADGFAVGPGTPATDPAAGNPGWTWWAPAR